MCRIITNKQATLPYAAPGKSYGSPNNALDMGKFSSTKTKVIIAHDFLYIAALSELTSAK